MTFSPTAKRYVVIGLSVYLLELGIIAMATQAGASATLAVGISFWIGLLASFVLQKFVAFGDRRMHHRVLLGQAIAYTLLVLFNFGFTLALTAILSPALPAMISRSLALGITTIWNFALYKTKIFAGSPPATSKKRSKRNEPRASRVQRLLGFVGRKTSRLVARVDVPKKGYMWSGVVVLLLTSVLWAYLGTQVHQGNADQLVNAFMFESPDVARGAQLPAQHTFLLKVPLLWLVNLLGSTDAAFVFVTVLVTLLTVGGLAFVLYKIIREPVPFGLVCLALACMLLMVPAQPYPGATLPVNMAMLTTRNIEYIVFIASLVLVAKIDGIRLKSRKFWVAAACAGLLIISDKLFLPFYIGGPLLLLLVYGLLRQRKVVVFACNWLLTGVVGYIVAMGLLQVMERSVLHFVGGGVGPYNFVSSLHDVALGSAYAVLGLFTNFGVNPALDPTVLKDIPQQALASLTGRAGLALVVNVLVACVGIVCIARMLWASRKKENALHDWPHMLAIALVSATVISVVAFVATDHYYPVDARYLAIGFFALAVGLALAAKRSTWLRKKARPAFIVLTIGVVSACVGAIQVYNADSAAMTPLNARNHLVAAAMRQYRSEVLVGDYWRVIPARQAGDKAFVAVPLGTCTHPREVLTSSYWQKDFTHRSFAYLLSFEGHSADFPNCTLDEIVDAYGKPNKSVVIAGTRDYPKELLLFYDNGAHPHTATSDRKPPATVVPVSLDQLPQPECQGGKTIFSVVAHQDDDLLFMNPDRAHTIKNGDCIRTVYMTAGDAGSDQLYWVGREKGSEAAYDIMLGGQKQTWVDRVVRLPDGQFIIVANPVGNPRITLIFMRLPDGNVNGAGFKVTHNQSLARLESGKIDTVTTVNGQSNYSVAEVTATLERLMEFYKPDEVNTQAPLNLSKHYPDHSDHMAVGRFAQHAYQQFRVAHPQTAIKYYIGYPIHESAPNVKGTDYQNKGAIFFAYAQYDSGTCTTFTVCNTHTVYGEYLRRQYLYNPPLGP